MINKFQNNFNIGINLCIRVETTVGLPIFSNITIDS